MKWRENDRHRCSPTLLWRLINREWEDLARRRSFEKQVRFVLTSRFNGDSLYTNVSASSLIGYACDVSRVSRQPAQGWTSENRPSRRTFFCLIVTQKFLDFRSTRFSSIVYWKLYVGEVFTSYRNRMINRCKNKDTYVYHIRFARIRIY